MAQYKGIARPHVTIFKMFGRCAIGQYSAELQFTVIACRGFRWLSLLDQLLSGSAEWIFSVPPSRGVPRPLVSRSIFNSEYMASVYSSLSANPYIVGLISCLVVMIWQSANTCQDCFPLVGAPLSLFAYSTLTSKHSLLLFTVKQAEYRLGTQYTGSALYMVWITWQTFGTSVDTLSTYP